MSWSGAHIEYLEGLAKRGLSASLIARALNEKFGTSYTRDAVIGRMSRGLVPFVQPKLQFTAPTLPTLPPMPNGSNIPRAQRRTLLQLTNGICKWPFGEPQSPDFFFCGGDAIEGKPYCVGHCQVAYRGYWN